METLTGLWQTLLQRQSKWLLVISNDYLVWQREETVHPTIDSWDYHLFYHLGNNDIELESRCYLQLRPHIMSENNCRLTPPTTLQRNWAELLAAFLRKWEWTCFYLIWIMLLLSKETDELLGEVWPPASLFDPCPALYITSWGPDWVHRTINTTVEVMLTTLKELTVKSHLN